MQVKMQEYPAKGNDASVVMPVFLLYNGIKKNALPYFDGALEGDKSAYGGFFQTSADHGSGYR